MMALRQFRTFKAIFAEIFNAFGFSLMLMTLAQ
jgi:hypothetical protein